MIGTQQQNNPGRAMIARQGMSPLDYPLGMLSHWHRLARMLKGEPITPISLQPKFQAQAKLTTVVSSNHQLSVHYPWEIGPSDFAELYAGGPVSSPLASTWNMLNTPFM